MKKINIERLVPAGFDAEGEKSGIILGLVGASSFSIIYYSIKFNNALDMLYTSAEPGYKKTLIPGAQMADFSEIFRFSMAGFLLMVFCMIALAIAHYNYHFRGSKSIYLMKRLPDRRDFLRRCITVPLTVTLICIALSLFLTVIYFWIYMNLTPADCLVPGQWQRFWNF